MCLVFEIEMIGTRRVERVSEYSTLDCSLSRGCGGGCMEIKDFLLTSPVDVRMFIIIISFEDSSFLTEFYVGASHLISSAGK